MEKIMETTITVFRVFGLLFDIVFRVFERNILSTREINSEFPGSRFVIRQNARKSLCELSSHVRN